MSGNNEARIRLGVDGANDVRNALRLIKGDFSGLGADAKGLAQTLYGVGTGFVRLGVDVAKAANGMKAIDFGAAAEKYKALDDQLTRMAIRGGKGIDELRIKMRDYGKQVGASTGEFAGATKQFDRKTFAGVDESAEAMRTLGVYAEDTDRSLEEMIDLGADMWTKLGIPAQRLETELRKIQTIAGNTSLASGFLGLEDSIRRMLPMMAKFEGGSSRGGATLATIQKMGYGKEASEKIYGRIFGALGEEQEFLIRQAANAVGFKGAPVVSIPSGPQKGMPMISRGGMKALQQYTKGKPLYGTGVYFGGGMEGAEAARAFRRLNFDEVDLEEDRATLSEDLRETQEEQANAAWKAQSQHGRGDGSRGGLAGALAGSKVRRQSKFSGSEAGLRNRRDLQRNQLEGEIGGRLTQAQDQRARDLTTGQRAAVDTVTGYMPGVVQDAIHLGSAGYSERNNIGAAIGKLTGAIEALPGKIQTATQKGVEGAKQAPRVGVGDIFPEKQNAKVN